MSLVRAVAIDGPAGAGKSTVARELARRLGWRYVDTGAMYRAATLKAVREGADFSDPGSLAAAARDSQVELAESAGRLRVLLDGEDVTEEIRTPELTRRVRELAGCAPARAEMVEKQRALASASPVVMEGRDITTVVLPEAAAKFYLDASLAERARRRAREAAPAGGRLDLREFEREMASRDRSDRERSDGPLRVAPDAESVDTTGLTVAEVVDLLERRTRERLARAAPGV